MQNRRKFLASLLGAAVAVPLVKDLALPEPAPTEFKVVKYGLPITFDKSQFTDEQWKFVEANIAALDKARKHSNEHLLADFEGREMPCCKYDWDDEWH